MILLSGGIDGGTVTHVVELAEILEAVCSTRFQPLGLLMLLCLN